MLLYDPKTLKVTREFTGHTKGVLCMSHSAAQVMLYTAGFDNCIRVWNPYLNKPIDVLQGHTAPIVSMAVLESAMQIVSMSSDKMIRVWDVRRMACVQTIIDSFDHKPLDELTAMTFDKENSVLLTAGSQVRIWPTVILGHHGMPLIDEATQARFRGLTHAAEGPETASPGTVAMLWSWQFAQLLLVDAVLVRVYEVSDGRLVCEFKAMVQSSPLTAATLDATERRLFTGDHSGAIRVWNYNSGRMLYEFPSRRAEVSALLCRQPSRYVERPVVAGGWDRIVMIYADYTGGRKGLEPEPLRGHAADVTCLENCDGCIAAGAADGRILVWQQHSHAYKIPPVQLLGREGRPTPIEAMLYVKVGHQHHLVAGTGAGQLALVSLLPTSTPKSIVMVDNVTSSAHDAVASLGLSPDGMCIAIGDANGKLQVWNITDETPDQEWDDGITLIPWFGLEVHNSSRVVGVTYMHDLPLMAVACANGRCALYTISGSLFAIFGSEDRWPVHGPMIRKWLKQRDAVVATEGMQEELKEHSATRNIFKEIVGAVKSTNRFRKAVEGASHSQPAAPAALARQPSELEMRRQRSRANSTVGSSNSSPHPTDNDAATLQAGATARGQQATAESGTDADGLEIAFKPKIELFVPRNSRLSTTQLRRKMVTEKYAADVARMPEVPNHKYVNEARAPPHDLDIISMFESQEKIFASADDDEGTIDVSQVLASLQDALATFLPDVYMDDLLPHTGHAGSKANESPLHLQKRVTEIIKTVKVVNHYRTDIKSVYNFYATSQLINFERARFCVTFAQFKRFARDAHCSSSVMMLLDRIFMTCNIERDGSGQRKRAEGPDSDGNPNQGMVMKEFVEGILRLGSAQYPSSKLSLAEKASRFMTNHVMMHCACKPYPRGRCAFCVLYVVGCTLLPRLCDRREDQAGQLPEAGATRQGRVKHHCVADVHGWIAMQCCDGLGFGS